MMRNDEKTILLKSNKINGVVNNINNKINEIAFKDRDALMTNISDVQVDIDEIDSQTVIKNILKEIESYYDKKLR